MNVGLIVLAGWLQLGALVGLLAWRIARRVPPPALPARPILPSPEGREPSVPADGPPSGSASEREA